MDNKECSKCKETKSLSEFYIDRKGKLAGRAYPSCKSCEREKQRIMRIENPTNYKARDRKKLLKQCYDLTPEDYELMLIKQNYCCAICKRPPRRGLRPLCVDHCHANGKIRGLLCDSCNTGLGLLEDNLQFLNEAIKYLEKGERHD